MGIGTSVHFIPLYRHPFYKETYQLDAGRYTNSEFIYPRLISLPIWPGMTEDEVNRVIESVNSLTQKFKI